MTAEELGEAVAVLRRTEPEVFDAITQRGVAQERARVVAHLDLGRSCHAEQQALDAIRSGAEMTAQHHAAYLTSSINFVDRYSRQRETDKVDQALEGIGAGDGSDLGDQIVAQLKAQKSSPFVRD